MVVSSLSESEDPGSSPGPAAMKQQILIIGGGTTFDTYGDYISYLKSKDISLDRIRPQKDWKDTLAEKLGNNFDVLLPKMPNSTFAKYREWEIWFGRLIPLLSNNIILVGHSLGGAFLAKYLSMNKVPKIIKATILVAAPYKGGGKEETLGRFSPLPNTDKFIKQCRKIFLIQSEDDPVVSFEHLGKYKRVLPDAKIMVFKDRGHFKQATFPEVVSLIKTLAA